VICPPPLLPETHPHRVIVTCPTCERDWIVVGRYPAWRPVRWWHRLLARQKETR